MHGMLAIPSCARVDLVARERGQDADLGGVIPVMTSMQSACGDRCAASTGRAKLTSLFGLKRRTDKPAASKVRITPRSYPPLGSMPIAVSGEPRNRSINLVQPRRCSRSKNSLDQEAPSHPNDPSIRRCHQSGPPSSCPFLADAGSCPRNCPGMEETTGAPGSFAVSQPRRLRASGRDGGGMHEPTPVKIRMLLSRHTRRLMSAIGTKRTSI